MPLFHNIGFVFLVFSYEEIVELLLKHGGRIDVEARMCWPGPHNQNCEERFKNCKVSQSSSDSSVKIYSFFCNV